jgi:hypothetical protein
VTSRRCRGTCGRNRAERFFTGPRGTVCLDCQKARRRKTGRRHRIKRTYGITDEEAELILQAQGGLCACRETRKYNLAVDHDHQIEREQNVRASVRGRLCKRCNKVLAYVRDNPQILRWLADYLEDPPARRILENLSN